MVARVVEDALAVDPAFEDAGVHEEAEVFGDVGLGGLGAFNDFGDGARALADGPKDAESRRFGEGLEDGG